MASLGMVYVLLAAGLSIIFGVMDVINFSTGSCSLGAYFALSITGVLGSGLGFWAALVVAPLLVGFVGIAIERFTIRPLYGRNPLYHILLTFGLVLIINDLIKLVVWGPNSRTWQCRSSSPSRSAPPASRPRCTTSSSCSPAGWHSGSGSS